MYCNPEIKKMVQDMVMAGMTNGEIESVFSGVISPATICKYKKELTGSQRIDEEVVNDRNTAKVIEIIEKSLKSGFVRNQDRAKNIIKIIRENGKTQRKKVYDGKVQKAEREGIPVNISIDEGMEKMKKLKAEREERMRKPKKKGILDERHYYEER